MKKQIVDIIFEAELIDEVLELEPLLEEDYTMESDIEMVTHITNDPYDGSYVVTPGQGVQILNTKNLVCNDNITIEAIPSNYGLVTWNGSILTVS